MSTQHDQALSVAIDRAHKTFLRQQQAAKNSVGGEKRRQQLQATADAAELHWKHLRAAQADAMDMRELAAALFADHQAEPHHVPLCPLCQQAAALLGQPVPTAHPFVAGSYMSDNGPVQTYHVAADDRLRLVPKLTAEQCAAALRMPDLQIVVRRAVERRQRALAKAGAA